MLLLSREIGEAKCARMIKSFRAVFVVGSILLLSASAPTSLGAISGRSPSALAAVEGSAHRQPAAPKRLVEVAALRLGGVVIQGGKPSALISAGRGPVLAYGLGDTVSEGVVIAAIGFDYVDLSSKKGRETLRFAPRLPSPSRPLQEVVGGDQAREAIARVAYAEAANQGDAGLAGVVYTILNRLKDGRWGDSIDAVVNAPRQFEPVSRVGGDWRALPAVSDAERARIDTILNLALEGHLPDLTGGARFFQNPAVVAQRVRDGVASPHLVDFGGAARSTVIGQHAFYENIAER
jgi:hypothetical protein